MHITVISEMLRCFYNTKIANGRRSQTLDIACLSYKESIYIYYIFVVISRIAQMYLTLSPCLFFVCSVLSGFFFVVNTEIE